MRLWFRLCAAIVLFVGLLPVGQANDMVRITEFMALNDGPLTDEDGDFSDWIEIHNGGTNIVNLEDWILTDRVAPPNPWRFPATNLAPNTYLLVFASGKDRRVPGAPLHTDFALGRNGEYLALLKPDGTNVATAYTPQFPVQAGRVSYGIPLQQTVTTLIGSGAAVTVFLPGDASLGNAWTMAGFDDSGWLGATTGVGYDTDGLVPFVPTALANSVTDFSGTQGQANWFYGYYDRKIDPDSAYGEEDFVPFPNGGGPFGPNNYFNATAGIWDWFNGNPPFTELTRDGGRPAGSAGNPARPDHWVVRRYVNESSGPLAITGSITHTSDWVYVTATGVAQSALMYIYLTGLGDGYIDDIKLVAGGTPEVGVNLISNGDFESGNLGPWAVAPNLAGSATTTAVKHSGNRSLHIVSTAGGSSLNSAISQSGLPLSAQPYTLSYWYLPNTNSSPLVVRMSGSWINTTPVPCGDRIVARIFADGVQVFQQQALLSGVNYSLTVPAHLGSKIDFVLDPGSANLDSCVNTIFTTRINTADPASAVVADAAADWSFTGTQGERNWLNGYYNRSADPDRTYQTTNFIAFPHDGGPPGPNNFWDQQEWDWPSGDPPFDKIGQYWMTPNGTNSGGEHWAIRRWVSEVSGPVALEWSAFKELPDQNNPGGGGVTVRIFHQGIQRDSSLVAGGDTVGVQRSITITNVQVGDAIDIAVDPTNVDGRPEDDTDRTFVTVNMRGTPSLNSLVQTDVAGMQGANATAYLRIPFTTADPSAFNSLTLFMKCDDGFVAYLNGIEVARLNAPLDPLWNSSATASRSDADNNEWTEWNLTSSLGLLHAGVNVLAIHGLNSAANDGDFLILPELVASTVVADPGSPRYFQLPTPGAANGTGTTNLGPIIHTATHTPNIPLDGENLIVTVQVAPTFRPVGTVSLIYRVNFSNEVTVAMFDDGAHGDGASGDGTFGATIPASASRPGELVRYYIAARDNLNNLSRFPAFLEPKNSPQYQGTVVFNPALTNPLPVVHLFVANTVAATNYAGTRGTVFWDGELFDNIEVSGHGQTTWSVFPKRSMNFNLNSGYRLRPHPGWSRVRAFDLLTTAADKAYLRMSLAFETFRDAGVPTHDSFPVRLQQNNAFHSVVHFVEQSNDDFLARNGLSPTGALYKIYLPLADAYTGVKKETRKNEPNDDLQAMLDGLTLSRPLEEVRAYLFDNVDIPQVVNFMATIQHVQNEDCCSKNYYLYRDTGGNGEWQMLPWDLDLTFGRTFVAWCGDGDCTGEPFIFGGYYDTNLYATNLYYSQARSTFDFIGVGTRLVNGILSYPDTLAMFYRRWTTIQEEMLEKSTTHPLALKLERRVDEYAAMIGPDAALDLQKWLPLNPRGFAPTNQTMAQAVTALKNSYITPRRAWVFNTLLFTNNGPNVGTQPSNAVVHFGSIEFNPSSGNQDQEYIQLVNPNNYSVDMSGWRVTGAIDYTFRPGVVIPSNGVLYVSPNVNAFRARNTGPRGGQGLFVQGNYNRRLSAHGELLQLADKGGRVIRTTNYVGSPSLAQRYLRITEIMYHPPSPPPGLAVDPEEFEYVELKNTGPVTMNLSGVRFTSGIEFNFTGSGVTSLPAGQSVLVVKNLAAFTSRYGGGFNVAGQYAGALENRGENIRLEDATGEKVLDFDYNNSWYPITDGDGFSLVIVNESAPWDSWGLQESWRPSGSERGSPGQMDTAPAAIAAIRINEVLSRSVPPAVDTVELYNPTTAAVNVRGWFLSDDFGTPRKFRVATDVIIPAGGYVMFDESHFNTPSNAPTSFAFSSLGDEAYLFSGDANTNLTGYVHGFDFGAAENGIPFGRHVTSLGEEHFVAQTMSTPGATNSGPKVGPVVVSEIMFRPLDLPDGGDNGLDEFVELHNSSAVPLALFDPAHPANTWRMTNAVDFSFPTGVTLPANGYALVVSFDPADTSAQSTFRARYDVPAGVPVFGPYDGKLDNSGESIELLKPDVPGVNGVPYLLVDRIDYQDAGSWPGGADGTQGSLQRRSSAQYGNDPINWATAAPTAGRGFDGGTPPVITSHPVNQTVVAFSDATFTVGATGTAPLRYQWRVNGIYDPSGTNASFVIRNVQPLHTAIVAVTVFNSAGVVTSSNASFTVLLPAYISRHPTNFLVRVAPDPMAAPSPSASFNVAAISTTSVRYQWQFNGANIPNATNATLTLTNVQLANEGNYTALVIDGVGSVASRAAQLIPLVTPTVVISPVSQYVAVGQAVTLSASFNGYPLPFSFDWRQGSVPIASNTVFSRTDFLTFTASATPRTNQYRAIVRNLASPSGVTALPALVAILADTNGDGIPDVAESIYGNPGLDGDGDGLTNGQEYTAGTDPANALSYLKFDSLTVGGGATIRFGAISNRTYTVEFSDDLGSASWSKLADVPARASNRVETIIDAGSTSNRTYRLATPRKP